MWAAWLWTVPYAKFVRDVFCHDGGDGGGADASRGTTVCGGGARTSAGSVQDASHGLARGLDGRLEREWIARREVVCHAICWGVPLLQIVLFGLLDAFGQHDSDQVSGVRLDSNKRTTTWAPEAHAAANWTDANRTDAEG
eukprot:6704768-Prymnesium_polylepis.1